MTESDGRTCPECDAPRGPDRSPTCDCTERTAEALRETRTVEAAAAEDFDPLRLRPYVAMEDPAPAPPEGPPSAPFASNSPSRAAVPPVAGRSPDAETRPVPTAGPERRRGRRGVLPSVAGAGVAVVAVGGLASGLFSYHTPSRDRAVQEVRESVPEVSATASVPPAPPTPPAVSSSPVPAPSAPESRPSPSATRSSSPAPTAAGGTPRPNSPGPSASASATPGTTPAATPVLRLGDRGPQVTELQERLRQLNLYGDQIDGVFDRPVEDAVRTYQLARGILGDPLGVYGPATRKSLEAETPGP